jgi:hypothetical protein
LKLSNLNFHMPVQIEGSVAGVMTHNAAATFAGFRTLIERRNGSLLRFMTVHHLLKSYYLVMLARPLMWLWCEQRTHLNQAADVELNSSQAADGCAGPASAG